uniref:Chemosensory protein 3 n=1 Tax=Clostera restitura TaxID=2008422 RepID=A0A385XVL2_9NEOP|nr:chemosensory protein 3 [Clostera restitura]
MKGAIVFCLLAVATIAVARPEDKYTDRYDNTNVQEIIDNDKLFEAYVKCVLEKGKCTADGKELKSHITDALENDCSKCTDPQKDGVRLVIKHLVNKEPAIWEELCAKYDPKKVYASKYEKELKEVTA